MKITTCVSVLEDIYSTAQKEYASLKMITV